MALEQMADVPSDENLALSDDERADMLSIADWMKIADPIGSVLKSCLGKGTSRR